MISLGSCAVILNTRRRDAAAQQSGIHEHASQVPEDQAEGYRELISNLSEELKIITGFAGVSLQPNPVRQANMPDSASSAPI